MKTFFTRHIKCRQKVQKVESQDLRYPYKYYCPECRCDVDNPGELENVPDYDVPESKLPPRGLEYE